MFRNSTKTILKMITYKSNKLNNLVCEKLPNSTNILKDNVSNNHK